MGIEPTTFRTNITTTALTTSVQCTTYTIAWSTVDILFTANRAIFFNTPQNSCQNYLIQKNLEIMNFKPKILNAP